MNEIRPMTQEELKLFTRATSVLPTPIKPNTNITVLNYILGGRCEELVALVEEAEHLNKTA